MLFDSFFQAGNIITLAIVLIILAVYRQLDKDNRSLEKLKKFADRMKDDIGSFVDEKSRDMQNLAIELDVHQKTAKEILSRLGKSEEKLQERSTHLEEVREKIDGYDASLKELGTMTGKVEENLRRIASESGFVDTVAKRVKAVAGQLDTVEKSVPEIEKRLKKDSQEILEALKQDIIKGVYDDVGRLKKEARQAGSQVEEFSTFISSLQEKQSDTERESLDFLRSSADELLQELDGARKNLEAEFAGNLESIGSNMQDEISSRIKAVMDEGRNLEGEIFDSLREYIEGRVGDVKAETAAWKVSADKNLETHQESLERQMAELNSRLSAFRKEAENTFDQAAATTESVKSQFREQYEEIRKSAESWQKEVENSLEGHRLGIQKKTSELEARLLEYEEDTGYRFSRIEEITRDMDQLEENLKASMDRVSAKIRKEFADFAAQLASERGEEHEKAEQELSAIRSAMGELENELNELKSKAYDSVSEKLKLFEDDFFSDLRERNASMQNQFQDWKENIRTSLDDLTEESVQKRQEVEERYSGELEERLGSIRNDLQTGMKDFESQVNAFYGRIEQKIASTETDMKSLEDAIRQDVEEARRQSRASFETIFIEHDTSIKDQIKKSEREFLGELKRLGDNLDAGRKELSSVLESAKSDVTVWQAQILQQLKEAESQVNEDLSGFKLSTRENTASLVQAYTEEQEELVQNSQAERARIRNEIKNLNESVLELQSELRKRTEEAFERQGRETENSLAEFQKRSRELLSEADVRLKEFRESAADIKEKVEGSQNKLFGKIEDQYKILSVKLQEIDKRQKNFVSQTKIFDRADSLKISLEESLEDLKSEIARVDAMSKEIKESERKFLKVQKLGEEVSAKFTRFLNERGRIEEMEGDFKKLINLSQAIDTKLSDVTSSHDTLTSLQAQLRQLEELEKEVNVKFERLESKGNILDATTSGVDKNFQTLRELEGRTKELGSQLSVLPQEFESVKKELRVLSENKERADQAVEKLEGLDSILNEVEERSQNLQQAREWLARTETRLQEVNKQAQEQVKLLGSIMKEENRRVSKEKGSPNLGAREVVTKLAHQGWSVEEIARATKLSRGEVELILELLPKKS
ncbi:SpiroCoCo family coiled-coil protein [Marispirochaeta sp.]|uniref:SpiroCoCo family coiled-coil protein n=1 Tax=Marispirochaeta sp. TaxID=2038653 RepID=UPI0029C88712|nr:hypothetical protein [Marispirochaeta sp.]